MTTPSQQRLPQLIVLDRDGTLITETGYLLAGQPFEFCPGALDAVAAINRLGIPLAIATNQSAIGRGWLSVAGLESLHQQMAERLRSAGAHIELWLYCADAPNTETGAEPADNPRRKPAPGMLLEAAAHFGVDPSASLSVGDSYRDLEAARRAGMPAWLVATGKGPQEWHRALKAYGRAPAMLPDLAALPPLLAQGLWHPGQLAQG
jgi:histidinol-phosphate phosphatase family protein